MQAYAICILKAGDSVFEKLKFYNNKHETDKIEHWQDRQTHKCNRVCHRYLFLSFLKDSLKVTDAKKTHPLLLSVPPSFSHCWNAHASTCVTMTMELSVDNPHRSLVSMAVNHLHNDPNPVWGRLANWPQKLCYRCPSISTRAKND